MNMKYRNKVQLFMLVSGFILLFTVIIPHHHHEGGAPCIFSWNAGHTTDDGDTGEEHHRHRHHHSCECNGHTIVFNPASLQNHLHENHHMLLLPTLFYTLFDYANPLQPHPGYMAFSSERGVYIEAQHSFWIPAATGLRAPPSL
jgi:hypothetical protein